MKVKIFYLPLLWLIYPLTSVTIASYSLNNSDVPHTSFVNNAIKDGFYINLDVIEKISAPIKVDALNPMDVSYKEVYNSLKDTVESAIKKICEVAQTSDYSYRIYGTDDGQPYTNLDLSNKSATIYVKISADLNSQYLVGSTLFIPVVLPKASDQFVNLNNITNIGSLTKQFNAINYKSVTYAEMKLALFDLIDSSVKNLNPDATFADYDYKLYSDSQGSVYQNIDLFGIDSTVYVKIYSETSTIQVNGATTILPVFVQAQELNLESIIDLSNNEVSVVAKDYTSVTYAEVKTAINPIILSTLQNIAPKITLSDYTFDVANNIDYSTYDPVDLVNQTDFVSVVIMANPNSRFLIGQTGNIIIKLRAFQNDLSEISKLDFNNNQLPTNKSLSNAEIINLLNPFVAQTVLDVAPYATTDDFSFEIASNNQGDPLPDIVNLPDTVYVKINSTPNNVMLKGQTNFIAVTFPGQAQSFFAWWMLFVIVVAILLLEYIRLHYYGKKLDK